MFYRTSSKEYPIHLTLGDDTYCKIQTEKVYIVQSEEPIVEGTTLVCSWQKGLHRQHMPFTRETSDYEKLYFLDVSGVEDRGEDDQLDVCSEFRENIVKRSDGQYEVGVPLLPGAKLSNTD